MTFLAQLQLKDVAAQDATRSLPTSGMLYFFVGVDEPAYNIEHRVLYLPEVIARQRSAAALPSKPR